MKDFEKTITFVRDFNNFCELIPKLWNGLYRDDQQADFIISQMRGYKAKTSLKGEELANEVKKVCPDLKELRHYYEIWCSVLEHIDTFPITEEDFNDEVQWACKLGDDDKGCMVAGLIRKMAANYDDVMEGKRWLENTYFAPCTEADQAAGVSRNVSREAKAQKHQEVETSVCFDNLPRFSISKLLPNKNTMRDLSEFLLKEGVTNKAVDADELIKRMHHAQYGGIVASKNKMKATICHIAKTYFGKETATDYRKTAAESIGIDYRRLTSHNNTKGYIARLHKILH